MFGGGGGYSAPPPQTPAVFLQTLYLCLINQNYAIYITALCIF